MSPRDPNRNAPLGPEPGRTTAPMPNSPYAGGGGYAPPPPPPTYASPPVAPPPAAYGGISGVYPQPPRTKAPPRRGGSFVGGIVAAIIIVALVGVGLAALNGGGLVSKGTTTAQVGSTPVGVATTAPAATPAPTLAPTFTPTDVPPTVAPSPNPHALPPPPPGFINYLPQNDDWGLNYRLGTQVHAQSSALPVTGQNVNAITFDLGQNATFTVYDLTQAIPADQGQTIFDAVAQALHAQDVQIISQGLAQVGANTWVQVHLRATIGGVRYEGYSFYAPHGSAANAVSMLAPNGDDFTAVNASDFQPMIDSFTYLS